VLYVRAHRGKGAWGGWADGELLPAAIGNS
jgi:hypothetical protein